MRYVLVEGGKLTLSRYIEVVRYAKAHPNAMFAQGFNCWWPCSGTEIMRQFRVGIHDRINQAIPYYKRGL